MIKNVLHKFLNMERIRYKIDKSLFNSLRGGLVGNSIIPDMDLIYQIAELPFDLTDFLCEINGFAFNGIEIFSLTPDALYSDDIFYCVPDIFTFRDGFEKRRPAVKDIFLPVGKGDDDIYLYNYSTEKYSINDRIDLMEYESFNDFIGMFEHLLAERGFPVSFEIKN